MVTVDKLDPPFSPSSRGDVHLPLNKTRERERERERTRCILLRKAAAGNEDGKFIRPKKRSFVGEYGIIDPFAHRKINRLSKN
jgi:hypothetical protein